MLILTMKDVLNCGALDMGLAIEDVRLSFHKYYAHDVTQPSKTHLENHNQNNGYINIMPSIVSDLDQDIPGIKIIGRNNNNQKIGLPSASGIVILFDAQTKQPKAIMDGQIISAMRTGAVSGFAARYLINKRQISKVALIGAGVNMKTQILGLEQLLHQAKLIQIYSLNCAAQLLNKMSALELNLQVVDSIQTAVTNADLIITCTTNEGGALIDYNWLKPHGVTIFSIGGVDFAPSDLAYFDYRIADDWLALRARHADSLSQAWHQHIITDDKVLELEGLIKHKYTINPIQDNIYFCTVGLGCHDVIMANRILQAAQNCHIGHEINLFDQMSWI
jgi:ornithine cyclodeaminase/alanine dehydrogenase-like protein (mu-crystallin family)